MEVVSLSRYEGKTHRAVEWVKAKEHRILLVIHEQERNRLRRPPYSLTADQVMSVTQSLGTLQGRNLIAGIGVDNIDLLSWRTVFELGTRFGHYIIFATETPRTSNGSLASERLWGPNG